MDNCIFCKIIKGVINADKIYEDENAIVIRDIAPCAPKHFLAIPKKHYPSVHDIPEDEVTDIMGGLAHALRKAATLCELDKNGYRLAVNSGETAGQTVDHLHIHILGGRDFSWPPG